MDFKNLNRIIKKHGLKPATERDLPLFTMSCIGQGYGHIKNYLGFSYGAIGAIGKNTWFYSFFNEQKIAKKTHQLIANKPSYYLKCLLPAVKLSEKQKVKFLKSKKDARNSPFSALQAICDFYPKYMTAIGIINCFWRLSQNDEYNKLVPSKTLVEISKIRNVITSWYPEVEVLMEKCLKKLPKNFPIKYLKCMTVSEMTKFADKRQLPVKLNVLKQRHRGYFYLINAGLEEKIITNEKILKKIKQTYFSLKNSTSVIKGQIAYKGKIKGAVYLAGKKNKKLPVKKFILVAPSTHPKMMTTLKRAMAIVTDEGGLLSHAAIISRELKIPCIIGTKIATKIFKDGDIIEVDANTGIVKKIS